MRAAVRLPGSKSMTNRALVLAALAAGPAEILGPLRARDSLLMAGALRALGATVDTGPATGAGAGATADTGPAAGTPATRDAGPGAQLAGDPGLGHRGHSVDVGNAGTVMRFVPPVAALVPGRGPVPRRPPRLPAPGGRDHQPRCGRSARPSTTAAAGPSRSPCTARVTLPGGSVTVDASASSQLVSGLLLAAPRYEKGLEVRHRGPRRPSAPHIAMTVQMLRDAGATVETAASTRPAGPGGPDGLFSPTPGSSILGSSPATRSPLSRIWSMRPRSSPLPWSPGVA